MKNLIFFLLLFPVVLFGQYNQQQSAKILFQKLDSTVQRNMNTPYLTFKAVSIYGDTLTNKDLIGKVTFINFWFEGCSPCIAEMPALKLLFEKHKSDPNFQLITFSKDNATVAQQTVTKLQLPFTVCCIADDCYRLSYNSGFPTSVILDKGGNLRYYHRGMYIDEERRAKEFERYEAVLTSLLTE